MKAQRSLDLLECYKELREMKCYFEEAGYDNKAERKKPHSDRTATLLINVYGSTNRSMATVLEKLHLIDEKLLLITDQGKEIKAGATIPYEELDSYNRRVTGLFVGILGLTDEQKRGAQCEIMSEGFILSRQLNNGHVEYKIMKPYECRMLEGKGMASEQNEIYAYVNNPTFGRELRFSLWGMVGSADDIKFSYDEALQKYLKKNHGGAGDVKTLIVDILKNDRATSNWYKNYPRKKVESLVEAIDVESINILENQLRKWGRGEGWVG